jgi:acetylcholinesterase
MLIGSTAHASAGTLFTSPDFRTEAISIWLNVNATPSPVGPYALKAGVDKVMSLYPDDPSAGSPFGTGNETFGTGSGYKREAAICMSCTPCLL